MTLVRKTIPKKPVISSAEYSVSDRLFYCRIGIPNGDDVTLKYRVYGETEISCYSEAVRISKILFPSENVKLKWYERIFPKQNYGQ